MQTRILTVAMVVIAVSAAVGMSAFTTGNVTRSSNVNVVTDDSGIIGLTDGDSGDIVQQNSTGALTIDFTRTGAGGVNTAAHFELGVGGAPGKAFNITNNDATTRDLTIEYTGAGGTSDTDNNIEFQLWTGGSTPTQEATVSEESTSATITGVSSGQSYAVVIVVDTRGLGSSADLSGTLKITAT